jgi:superfamily II DNA helicase RecQ
MKIKTFKIHLDDQLHQDEQTLNQFMETVSIKKTAAEFVTDKVNYWSIIVYYEDRSQKQDSIMNMQSDKITFPADTPLTQEESAVYNYLKKWRTDVAIKTSLPGYVICHNSELVTITKIKPKNLEELGKIKGFSSRKIMKYGDDILALLNSV